MQKDCPLIGLNVVSTGNEPMPRTTFALFAVAILFLAPAAKAAQPSPSQRCAFYYPWFPETWTVNGQHVSGSDSPQVGDGFYPRLGFYSSTTQRVIDQHIRWSDYGRLNCQVSSWWGQGSKEDVRLLPLLNRTQALGSPLKWTVYYEQEGYSNPSVSQISSDLSYLLAYASNPAWLRVGGVPVVFVYNADDTTCDVADRWNQANAGRFYVVLKVFSGYRSCANQPDSWHQYAPAVPADRQAGYSYSISPGFWRADEVAPRLVRDYYRFEQNVRDMVASNEPWQLVTTFNEWGEGTAVEPAHEWLGPERSQRYAGRRRPGRYLEALNRNPVG
jgi:glycosyl hydrolase family 99